MTEEQQKPTLGVHLGRCPPCRETKKMIEERQGSTLGVCFKKASGL